MEKADASEACHAEPDPAEAASPLAVAFGSHLAVLVATFSQSQPLVTGLLAASDTLVGAIKAVRDCGLRVPDDIAVVSFDDPFFVELLDPPITALARNGRQLGELAAPLLLHAIETGRFDPRPRSGCRSS